MFSQKPIVYGELDGFIRVVQERKRSTEDMKMAVVLFGERVSPHFGSSSKVMLIDYEGDAIRKRDILNAGGDNPRELARFLVEQGVNELICGGIQQPCKEWLSLKGVAVIENQRGHAEKLVLKVLESRANNFKKGDNI